MQAVVAQFCSSNQSQLLHFFSYISSIISGDKMLTIFLQYVAPLLSVASLFYCATVISFCTQLHIHCSLFYCIPFIYHFYVFHQLCALFLLLLRLQQLSFWPWFIANVISVYMQFACLCVCVCACCLLCQPLCFVVAHMLALALINTFQMRFLLQL